MFPIVFTMATENAIEFQHFKTVSFYGGDVLIFKLPVLDIPFPCMVECFIVDNFIKQTIGS